MANTNEKLVNVSLLDLNNELARNYIDTVDNSIKADVTDLSGKIDTLNGEKAVAGSVRNIAAEEVAAIVAGAPEDFDTLKEMADWLTEHSDDATAMNSAIKSNTDAITVINDETNGVVATAKNYADELNSAMDARVAALETASAPIATEEEIRALWAAKDSTESE